MECSYVMLRIEALESCCAAVNDWLFVVVELLHFSAVFIKKTVLSPDPLHFMGSSYVAARL